MNLIVMGALVSMVEFFFGYGLYFDIFNMFNMFKLCFCCHFNRVEYDAYRTDLEELNMGPRDATTLPKIEQSQQLFQMHKEKYDKMRGDVSIKLKFLEENKVILEDGVKKLHY